jgi:hypothetical protein
MTEEIKKSEEKKCCASGSVSMLVKIIAGAILVLLGAILWWKFRADFLALVKGILGPFLMLVGLVFFAIAKE